MNPPGGIWKIAKNNPTSQYDALYWDGSQYVDYNNITEANVRLFDNNPAYQEATSMGTFGLEMQGGTLETVEAVANKVKKIFSKETYQTPKGRRNTIFIIITLGAIVFGYMVYKGKIKI